MKARVERDVLRMALKMLLPATQTRTAQLPILSCVRLAVVEDGRLRFTTTDLDLTVRVTVVADATSEGMAAVPARLLAAVLDKAPEGAVELCVADGMLDVSAGEVTARLNTLNVDEWPRTAEPPKRMLDLTPEQVNAIRRVIPAASKDHKRPSICTIHFEGDTVEATDSYRAMRATVEGADLPEVIIPAEAVANALKHADSPVQIGITDRTVTIASPLASWTVCTAEGPYPDLGRLMAEHGEATLTVPADRLVQAINVAMAIGEAPVVLTRDGDRLLVSADNHDLGRIDDAVEGCSGDFEGEVRFNPQFLQEAIAAAASSVVTIEPAGLKPTVINSDGFRQILVPLRPGVK